MEELVTELKKPLSISEGHSTQRCKVQSYSFDSPNSKVCAIIMLYKPGKRFMTD